MVRSLIALLVLPMIVGTEVLSQTGYPKPIEWKIAGLISPQDCSLGLSGIIAGIHNNVLVTGGGTNFPDGMPWKGGKKKYYDCLYFYRENNEGVFTCFKTVRLPFNLAYTANCSTSRGIIAAGGENESGPVKKVFLIQWDNMADSAVLTELPDLPVAVTNASVAACNGRVYLAGGETKDAVSDKMFLLDLNIASPAWQPLVNLPKAVSHAVMVAHSNNIYILGGRKRNPGSTSDLYASTLSLDLATGQWLEKQPMPYSLSAGTGLATGKHFIILFGGDKGETFHKAEQLIAAIGKEKDEEKKRGLREALQKVQALHPGFSKQVLLYDIDKNDWKVVGQIPYDVPVTTTALEWKGTVIIPGGEIRAGVRTNQIISAKISE